MLTLDDFLAGKARNSYVRFPGFKDLYVRKTDRIIKFHGFWARCHDLVTIAIVSSMKPGSGAFKALVAHLVAKDKAVLVECVHEPWFQDKLIEWGYTRVNHHEGHHYLFNYEGHLVGEPNQRTS